MGRYYMPDWDLGEKREDVEQKGESSREKVGEKAEELGEDVKRGLKRTGRKIEETGEEIEDKID